MKNQFNSTLVKSFLLVFIFFTSQDKSIAQEQNAAKDQSYLSGSLQANGNFFMRDTLRGAANTPQYDHQLFGAESWLGLNYNRWGFDMGIRFDLFNNSNLLNPLSSYSAQGIGRWFISKKVSKFDFMVGYIYDQIGSGIIYRAYEERPLSIDNALLGLRVGYQIAPNWKVKAFTGKQKQQFNLYDAVIKGCSVEGYIAAKEGGNWSLTPGVGVVNRTLDDGTMSQIVSEIRTYTPQDSIVPNYNAYAYTLYNLLNIGDFAWYIEGAYKTDDVIFDPNADKLNWNSTVSKGKLIKKPGTVLYTSLTYTHKSLGITLETKRTDHFTFRTDPRLTLIRGQINFLPPMSRANSYRLTARYVPATQELGEQAFQADVRYKFNKKWAAAVNFSNITDLNSKQLYREIYSEVNFKPNKSTKITGGLQYQVYDQEVYYQKPGYPVLTAITPYIDILYKFSAKNSIRTEFQYMSTKQDFGSWLFGLAEIGFAPNWIITISDMYNVAPKKTDDLHYPTFGASYSHSSNRFSLYYVKQVEGIVCTGGICRLEPAFSGVKMTVNSTF
ncbi:MAG: hypothetical protein KA010_02810 [Saprospiraceae bacterium]|nr:hypothetical protein [Saprospiraceae bacterium]